MKKMHWVSERTKKIVMLGKNNFHTKRKLDHDGKEHEECNQDQEHHSYFKQPRIQPQLPDNHRSTSLWEERKALPIASARSKFLEEIRKHPTVILVGETGSGKTTQIPQFLHEDRLDAEGSIAVTQPRRMAAISISGRVAQEMNVTLGTMVGYKVRFEDMSDSKSKIVFLTDGMLLREAMLDPKLMRYSWIILDEAHERTVNTDILFGIVKAAQAARFEEKLEPLRVIVMSATLDADLFSQYFRNAPILYVAGRQHPVNVSHLSEHQEDWQHTTLSTIFQIHREVPEKQDMLVFLTGQEEIESMCRQIRQIAKESEGPKVNVISLYAAQSSSIQNKIFSETKSGHRKIVLATNIAETSITIPGIHYVIDSCRVKAKVHVASTGLDMLQVVKVSQAQAWQRTGRAGRETEGHCYRILTKSEFDKLPQNTVPEIKRCNLNSVVLQMLSIGVKEIQKFDFLEPPPQDAIDGALRQLKLLGAVNKDLELTDLGKKMSAFPLDPRFTKMILSAEKLGCTEDVISIVSILSGDSILVNPIAKRDEALAARKKFYSPEGDHLTYLKMLRAFRSASDKVDWCNHHFVHFKHIQFALKIRSQLMDLCKRHNVAIQSCGNHTEKVQDALVQGLYTNVARLTSEGHYVALDSKLQVQIHPSSVLFQAKPELVLFTELISTQKSYIRDVTFVDGKTLLECQPEYFRHHRIVQ